ncbi:hypothetical protein [Flavobacterium sp.]|uniref:hypothetical protein n=1 Tax=Flavobacterium sp. TaxID=239 RepID=UPI001B44621A|nr:hypothetical protein [Flavobacterium sp.]MBP6128037.1 hypothetical protein [Flavobacterium sp.]
MDTIKKIVEIVVIILFVSTANAQTGIGTTTPNASAKLDITSTNKGFLPPRVALTAANVFAPVTGLSGTTELATAAGLLIYNTATSGTTPNNVVPGYYYWNGTAWIQISGGLVIETKSASFSLAASDNNKLFFINSASTVTVSVPTLPIGFSCQLIQTGAGTITFSGNGTTLNSASGLSTRTTNSVIGLVMNSTNVGYVFGDTIF